MRFLLGLATASALSACSGGNPFLENPEEPVAPGSGIPDVVASDLDGFSYDPNTETLTVTGVTFEGTPFVSEPYVRNARLDSGDYKAYTLQKSPLDAHSTAYVRDINGTQGGIVVTGGQFGYYNGGGYYARSSGFDRPDASANGGNTKYVGTYVGLMNFPDDGSDLLPVPPGTDPEVRPGQAARISGDARIVADFANNRVKGLVFNRQYVAAGTSLTDLEISPTDIAEDGTFAGKITQNHLEKGDYGGLFGGTDSEAVAGALFAKDHVDGIDEEEEYGVFVLDKR